MRTTMRFTSALLLVAAFTPAASHAQVPVRPIGSVVSTTTEPLGIVGHMRALPGGRLLELADADGSALVLHAQRDDYATDPSGNSGARIACAVIAPG